MSSEKQKLIEVSCVGAWGEVFSPTPVIRVSAQRRPGERRGGLVSHSPQPFFTHSELSENTQGAKKKIPHSCSPGSQAIPAILLLQRRRPWVWTELLTGCRVQLHLVLNFTLNCKLPLTFNFKNALKITEFLKANKGRIRGKHRETGGWRYHVCQRECQCHDLRGEGKKISLWSAYLALHLC